MFKYNGRSINLLTYYKEAHNIDIKNKKQPLIVVKNNDESIYFIPELCYLGGLDDSAVRNGQFMKELANYTKLKSELRVNKTDQFLKLLNNTENKIIETKIKDKDTGKETVEKIKLPSAKEKTEKYRIEIQKVDEKFKAYYIESPKLIAGKNENEQIAISTRVFTALKVKHFTKENWLFLYEEHNYDEAELLLNTMIEAAESYGIKVDEPEWAEMPDRSNNPRD